MLAQSVFTSRYESQGGDGGLLREAATSSDRVRGYNEVQALSAIARASSMVPRDMTYACCRSEKKAKGRGHLDMDGFAHRPTRQPHLFDDTISSQNSAP